MLLWFKSGAFSLRQSPQGPIFCPYGRSKVGFELHKLHSLKPTLSLPQNGKEGAQVC